jgi:hypothetical protein
MYDVFSVHVPTQNLSKIKPWMKEEKGIRHRGEGTYLRCPVSTSVQFSLRNEGSSEYILVGSLKMNTALEYSTRVVQEGDRRCKKSTLNDLAYLTPLRIPLMNPVYVCVKGEKA